jgi:subtilisin family serine protease
MRFMSRKNKGSFLFISLIFCCWLQTSPAYSRRSPKPQLAVVPTRAAEDAPRIEAALKNNACRGQILMRLPNVISRISLKINPGLKIEQIGDSDIYLIKIINTALDRKDLSKLADRFLGLENILEDSTPVSPPATQDDYPIELQSCDLPLQTTADLSETQGLGLNTITEPWGVNQIQAQQAQFKIQRPGDVIVAVLDSGVQTKDHPILEGHLWEPPSGFFEVSVGEISQACGAGTHGFNFLAKTKEEICLPEDDNGHGTNVAGIIGGGHSIGVAQNVKILPIKIFDEKGEGCLSDVIRAWYLLVKINKTFPEQKIIVVNNSFGFSPNNTKDVGTEILNIAVKYAGDNGLLLVAAAGNFKSDIGLPASSFYPASIDTDNIIAVTATNKNHNLVQGCGNIGSNYGKSVVDVTAPGTGIITSSLRGNCRFNFACTSAATPFVSGAAALVQSACSNTDNVKIKGYLEQTAAEHEKLRQWVKYGRINVLSAVTQCQSDELFATFGKPGVLTQLINNIRL